MYEVLEANVTYIWVVDSIWLGVLCLCQCIMMVLDEISAL